MFGWLSNSLTANENDNVTAQVGYIKGAFDARVNLGFRLGRTFENASGILANSNQHLEFENVST